MPKITKVVLYEVAKQFGKIPLLVMLPIQIYTDTYEIKAINYSKDFFTV